MVTVRKSKLLSTSSAVQPNTYYYEFDVDTISELPDPYYNGSIVAHGSKATIINSGEIYRINGDGEWKAQSTSGGAELPEVTSEDNGDVLTVVDGAWDKAEPAKELPTVTSADNGDVLTVVDGVWSKATPNATKIYTLVSAGLGNYDLGDGALMSDVYNDLENGVNVVIVAVTATNKRYLQLQRHVISQDVDSDIYYFFSYFYNSANSEMVFVSAEIKNTESARVRYTSVTVNVP